MAVAETAYSVPQISATTLKNSKSLLKILILGSIAGEYRQRRHAMIAQCMSWLLASSFRHYEASLSTDLAVCMSKILIVHLLYLCYCRRRRCIASFRGHPLREHHPRIRPMVSAGTSSCYKFILMSYSSGLIIELHEYSLPVASMNSGIGSTRQRK